MSRRLPPLNGLRAFEAAARHLSFTLASEELHVTQGAISRAVKGLEDHLGTHLFQRLPRKLALTTEGKVLLAGVTEGLDRIAQAAAKVEARAHDLQVKVPPTFTIRWLMRRLIRFQTSRPESGCGSIPGGNGSISTATTSTPGSCSASAPGRACAPTRCSRSG
jgi:LysR family transcriptional regulator, glycine cleavage system transcriptional activator